VYIPLTETRSGLVPQPPAGQIKIPEIKRADMEGLEVLAAQRGVTMESLFTPKYWKSIVDKSADLDTLAPEDRMRIALMYVDGRSWGEIAAAFRHRYPAQDLTAIEIRLKHSTRWFSDLAESMGKGSRHVRKLHAILQPEDPVTEQQIRALEEKSGLQRDRIFYFDQRPAKSEGKELGATPVPPSPVPRKGRKTVYSTDLAVRLLYMRFYEGKSTKQLVAEAEKSIGSEIDEDKIVPFFKNILTPEAKRAFGMKGCETATEEEVSEREAA